MLELRNVTKSYTVADFAQTALDDVSIVFRDNEFAAILGPSGSGKTTLLNIIGGLDRYDSGDLIIDGISTENYHDRDWDTYRNNRIGFVFQSYNLIHHQSVLANVELALSLAGVSKQERRERALRALDEVGLADHARKRPSQLSGGQMQRVAIARALINDPEILLADEPTGALDSTTSVQVMDLLSRIAQDRLVIMVTHNPELAAQYANRIVNLADGQVVADTRPVALIEPRVGQAVRRAAMSFATALTLSFSNLMTKKGRTLVTAFAGSIGIIGIATILALATGIETYIQNVEEETLSIYPLSIQSSGVDISALFDGHGGSDSDSPPEPVPPGMIRERPVVQRLFASRRQNDLAALKEYLEANEETLAPLVGTIQYRFDVTPQIYLADATHGIEQVNPDAILATLGVGRGGMSSMLGFGAGFGMTAFHEMLQERAMFEDQYDVLAGRWPDQYDEAVVVLSSRGSVTDFELYALGIRDRAELRSIVNALASSERVEPEFGPARIVPEFATERRFVTPSELLAADLRVVNPVDKYVLDREFDVWVDRSQDAAHMARVLSQSLRLQIVGVVQPADGAAITALASGINYLPSLVRHLMDEAARSGLVRQQLGHPEINAISGGLFVQEQADNRPTIDLAQFLDFDTEVLQAAFAFDLAAVELDANDFAVQFPNLGFPDLAGLVDLGSLTLDPSVFDLADLDLDLTGIALPPPPQLDFADLARTLAGAITVDPAQVSDLFISVLAGFLPELITITDPAEIPGRFQEYLARPEVQQAIRDQIASLFDAPAIQTEMADALQKMLQSATEQYLAEVMDVLQAQLRVQAEAALRQALGRAQADLQRQLGAMLTGAGAAMQSSVQAASTEVAAQVSRQVQAALAEVADQVSAQMFALDPATFQDAVQFSMDEEAMTELLVAIMNPIESSFERNLNLLGYANPEVPSQIDIYPRNFAAKQEVIQRIDAYNERMVEQGTPERVVTYTDFIGAIMTSVTDIVGMVTIGLVAFVAISLVVSSIMIGVITYISVLERRKEIGILRAVGASKKNIKQVFNAETLIIGFVAGALGIAVTLLITTVGNAIVHSRWDIQQIARLPLGAALALIGVSMFLTFVSGLIPATAAARRDPVAALRSE